MKFTKNLSIIPLVLLLLTSSLVRAEAPEPNDQSVDADWFGGTLTDKTVGDTIGLRCTKRDPQHNSEREKYNKDNCIEFRMYRSNLGLSTEPISPPIQLKTVENETKDPSFNADDRAGLFRLTEKSYRWMFGVNGKFLDRYDQQRNNDQDKFIFLCGLGIGEVLLLWGPVTDTVLLPVRLSAYGIRRLHHASVERHFKKNMLRLLFQKNINTSVSHHQFVQFEESIQKIGEMQAKGIGLQ